MRRQYADEILDVTPIRITKKSGAAPAPLRIEPPETARKKRFGRGMAARALICTVLICCAAAVRGCDSAAARKVTGAIETVMTDDFTLDGALGTLKFVRGKVEDAVTAFAGTGAPGIALELPCAGDISARFIEDEHEKIDIACAAGADIVAPADGVVKGVIEDDDTLAVMIEHENGYTTILQGAGSAAVSAGDAVQAGDVVAFAPEADGCVVSLTLYYGATRLNPLDYVDVD